MDDAKLGAKYLNVDLEIRSRSDLKPLADAVATQLLVLHVGRMRGEFFLSLEMSDPSRLPDAAIRHLAHVISSLPPSVHKLWTQARDRVFDVGLEATHEDTAFALALRPETVRMVARLNARIAVTVYPTTTKRQRRPTRRSRKS